MLLFAFLTPHSAYYRKYDDDIPPAVMEISTYDPTSGTWETPPKAVMERRKIVVTTCINAGQLYALSFKPFTHIFVDEAGQAMEPECLVSLSALVAANTVCPRFLHFSLQNSNLLTYANLSSDRRPSWGS